MYIYIYIYDDDGKPRAAPYTTRREEEQDRTVVNPAILFLNLLL